MAVALVVLFVYFGAYAWARTNLILVHFEGGFIARSDTRRDIGVSVEWVFLPASTIEVAVRSTLDPTW